MKLLPLLLLLALAPAWAAKADRQRPLIIQGGDGTRLVSQSNERTELLGPVTVTQGSLLLRASKLVHTKHADDSNHIVAGAADGQPVQFSQALDTPGERMEGQADEVTYDQRSSVVRFVGNARVRMFAETQLLRESVGSLFEFNTNTGLLTADGQAVGKPGGNLRFVIMPKKAASAPEPAKPLPLQTAPALKPQ